MASEKLFENFASIDFLILMIKRWIEQKGEKIMLLFVCLCVFGWVLIR